MRRVTRYDADQRKTDEILYAFLDGKHTQRDSMHEISITLEYEIYQSSHELAAFHRGIAAREAA